MAAATLAVAACGGGGGGDSFAGIDRLGVSSGTITGFGSIFVNGVEWETNQADIRFDDNSGIESDLRLGQVVTVRGRLNAAGTAGTADSVEFDNEVEGTITSINPAAGSFVVLGQTVIVSPDTVFAYSICGDLGALQVGDAVEVSGQRDSAGAIRATRLELRSGGLASDELKGVVTGLNAGNSTFQIGGITVNYAGASFDPSTYLPGNGDLVEVRGSVSGDVLVATTIEREDDLTGDNGDQSEVEGYIRDLTRPAASVANFTVSGVRVITNAGTEYDGGSYAALANDLKVEVEGQFNGSGELVADKVDFRVQSGDNDVEIAGQVSSVSTSAGTLAIEGVLVRVTSTTLFEDKSPADLASFRLADVNVGDYLEIRGAEDVSTTTTANDMIATRIERDDFRDEAILRGPVQSVNQPELTVLGVTIDTDFAVFRDLNDVGISEATFFATIRAGDVVKAKTNRLADFNGSEFLAEEVEIEELD